MRARSGDAPLLGHLRGCHGRGSLHSAFTHALNLLTPDGRLMTLAAAGSDDAPWTLVVDAACFPALEAGQPVTFTPGTLDLG
ncbi:MAG: hypothetical protein HOY71_00685, partial [Nonomuraea sp.]|nr:hypothetical protein [Nonomuraea sp.]